MSGWQRLCGVKGPYEGRHAFYLNSQTAPPWNPFLPICHHLCPCNVRRFRELSGLIIMYSFTKWQTCHWKFCSSKIVFQPVLHRGSVVTKEWYWCPKCPKPIQRLSIKLWPEKYHHGKKHGPPLSCIENCKMKLTMPCHLPNTSSEQPELVSFRWALNSNKSTIQKTEQNYMCVFFLLFSF